MTIATITEKELRAAIAGVFADNLVDPLQERIVALCKGLHEESVEDLQYDHDWAQRVYPRFERWLARLEALERGHQTRMVVFLDQMRQLVPEAAELYDVVAQERLERTWIAVAEWFESVMPDELLTSDSACFFVDIDSESGWWNADNKEEGLELQAALAECLQVAGEFSNKSVERLVDQLAAAICEGTAPLPGFQFKHEMDGVAVWQWKSPEGESSEPLAKPLLEDDDSEILKLWEHAPNAIAELQCTGLMPLPERAIESIPSLVASVRSFGVSDKTILQEIGGPLVARAQRAIRCGNLLQFQLTSRTLGAFTAQLGLGQKVTAP
jgi:hypothetical protein